MTVSTWRRGLFAAAALLSLAACGADGRYVVIGSPRAPNASGTIELDALDGDNTQVALHLEFLNAPARVASGLTTYVVWFLPQAGAPARGGALKYNGEQRTGDLSATSPFRHFTAEITAEREAFPKAPSNYVIATQEVKIE